MDCVATSFHSPWCFSSIAKKRKVAGCAVPCRPSNWPVSAPRQLHCRQTAQLTSHGRQGVTVMVFLCSSNFVFFGAGDSVNCPIVVAHNSIKRSIVFVLPCFQITRYMQTQRRSHSRFSRQPLTGPAELPSKKRLVPKTTAVSNAVDASLGGDRRDIPLSSMRLDKESCTSHSSSFGLGSDLVITTSCRERVLRNSVSSNPENHTYALCSSKKSNASALVALRGDVHPANGPIHPRVFGAQHAFNSRAE